MIELKFSATTPAELSEQLAAMQAALAGDPRKTTAPVEAKVANDEPEAEEPKAEKKAKPKKEKPAKAEKPKKEEPPKADNDDADEGDAAVDYDAVKSAVVKLAASKGRDAVVTVCRNLRRRWR